MSVSMCSSRQARGQSPSCWDISLSLGMTSCILLLPQTGSRSCRRVLQTGGQQGGPPIPGAGPGSRTEAGRSSCNELKTLPSVAFWGSDADCNTSEGGNWKHFNKQNLILLWLPTRSWTHFHKDQSELHRNPPPEAESHLCWDWSPSCQFWLSSWPRGC